MNDRRRVAEATQDTSVMVGRQPIMDRQRRVLAYELLMHTGGSPVTADSTPDEAAAQIIADGVLSLGLETLTHGRTAFVELTPDFLRHDVVKVLPARRVVLQVPCDALQDVATAEACRELRAQGYRFALSRYSPAHASLVSQAAFVKVDAEWSGDAAPPAVIPATAFIANGVDRVADFERASRSGFTHFQGFFFERPSTLQTQPVPRGQIGYLRLLCALNDPNLSLRDLEDLLKRDASLCYRMLRTVNSAGFAQSREVTSISHALLLLGRDTIRRWASLWVLSDLGGDSPAELTVMASLRGRFCERLTGVLDDSDAAGERFLLGMCSCLDVILGRPMAAIVGELPLAAETTAALLGTDNKARRLLECVMAYERGHWEASLALANNLGISRSALISAHAEAITWVHKLQQSA